jgi:hypothetical protein
VTSFRERTGPIVRRQFRLRNTQIHSPLTSNTQSRQIARCRAVFTESFAESTVETSCFGRDLFLVVSGRCVRLLAEHLRVVDGSSSCSRATFHPAAMKSIIRNRALRLCGALAATVALLTNCADQATAPARQLRASGSVVAPPASQTGSSIGSNLRVTAERAGANGTTSVASAIIPGDSASLASVSAVGATALGMSVFPLLHQRTHKAKAGAAPAGILRSAIVVDSITGDRAYMKSLRSEAGAPVSRSEVVVNGKVISAMLVNFSQDGDDYVASSVTMEYYKGDSVAVRVTYEQTPSPATSAGAWTPSTASGPVVSKIRNEPRRLGAANVRRQDLCDRPHCSFINAKKPPKTIRASLSLADAIARSSTVGAGVHSSSAVRARHISRSRNGPAPRRELTRTVALHRGASAAANAFAPSLTSERLASAAAVTAWAAKLCMSNDCGAELTLALAATRAASPKIALLTGVVLACFLLGGVDCIGLAIEQKTLVLDALEAAGIAVASWALYHKCKSGPAT